MRTNALVLDLEDEENLYFDEDLTDGEDDEEGDEDWDDSDEDKE